MGLVFYDTETTGTEVFFDQILQFAAVLTDEGLKAIDRFEIRCRILPHVVPAPGAMGVTAVKASQLTDASYPSHYEMVRAIAEKIKSWSPALFVGWNSIRFDEDLIRQALYKTLHKPYLTNSDGNTRSDVMRITQACSLFAPDSLRFPTDQNGQKIFKLDQVALANGFQQHDAHDAMGDVQATIFLSKLIIEKAPHIWSAFMRFSKKASVVDYIKGETIFCFNEFYYGQPHSFIVTEIGVNPENGSEYYVYDLSIDPETVARLDDTDLQTRLAQSPKPVRKVRCNAAPIIFGADEAPGCCRGRELGSDEFFRRAEALKADTDLCQRLITAIQSQAEEYAPSPHVEKQIYDRFFDRQDEQLMTIFHTVPWPNRVAIVEKLQDSRLRTIGKQLIHIERPDLLDDKTRRELDLATAKRILGKGDDIAWLTIPTALLEMEAISQELSGAELERMREHEHYLRSRHAQALTHLTE